MNFALKQNMLLMVGIITLCSLLGYVVLIYSAHLIGSDLRTETRNHIKLLIDKNARQIESTMRLMEKNAEDLATAGEAFFAIHTQTGSDITPAIKTYLRNNFKKLPEAVGGGLWYEPFVILDKRRYGPYVYRENNQVHFTWDLNTSAYDYHNQDWYRLAIPKQGDRSRKRPRRTYWTEPYMDEAATEALMITVDALMNDPKKGIIGMATVDLSLEDLKDMVARMTVTPNSRPFAVDLSSGLLIAYPADPDRVLHGISDLGWGTAVETLDVQPDKVTAKQIQIDKADFSFFYTGTGTGFAVGILSPHKELYADLNHLRNVILVTSIVVISVQLILFFLVALFMVRRVCNPIARLTGVARQIAQGNLQDSSRSLALIKDTAGSHKDETGQLLVTFEEMTTKLNALLAQVQQAGNQVATSSNEISTSSSHLEANISDQATSAHQVSVSSKQISQTADSLAETMNEVTTAASKTATLAGSGQKGLSEMETTMQGVLKGTTSISDQFEEIKENSGAISSIVTTITKVADQTNLLSLNAAIEAEKAGEYGMGFSVVADEIRRLADQTSVAVLDIEEMINRMEKSVSIGATEMENFSQDVGNAVHKINEMGRQLDGIMESVRTLTPRFESVNQGMETQSLSAGQISETMAQLNTLTQNTLESIREFKLTAQYLNTAASDLQNEVSRFKVGGQMEEGTD
ncbi:MAG: methyl-accepting chemotaxis protein [Thermodesulfobacteriota bacterium]